MKSNCKKTINYFSLLQSPHYLKKVEKIARCQTRRTTISWEDASQAAHEKILQALRARKFNPEKGNFYHWSATVAKLAIIDLIRREKQRNNLSLDQTLAQTKSSWLEQIPDNCDLWATLEREDLLMRLTKAITQLEQRYPQRHYLKLWQGKIQGKTQVQLATELRLNQSAISKRWKELVTRVTSQ
jgi:RNA polymerase sigma factor (sigma-70 family)